MPGNHAAESFVSFIPLFDGRRRSSHNVVASRRHVLATVGRCQIVRPIHASTRSHRDPGGRGTARRSSRQAGMAAPLDVDAAAHGFRGCCTAPRAAHRQDRPLTAGLARMRLSSVSAPQLDWTTSDESCLENAAVVMRRSLSVRDSNSTRRVHARGGCRFALPPHRRSSNTGDKLRSGARVHAVSRRGHSAAPPAERRLRREGWCRRKLRQLHPLVRPHRDPSGPSRLAGRAAVVDAGSTLVRRARRRR